MSLMVIEEGSNLDKTIRLGLCGQRYYLLAGNKVLIEKKFLGIFQAIAVKKSSCAPPTLVLAYTTPDMLVVQMFFVLNVYKTVTGLNFLPFAEFHSLVVLALFVSSLISKFLC